MRQTDDDYREAEAKAYHSMGLGCLLIAVALLIASGVAVWTVIRLFQTLPFGF